MDATSVARVARPIVSPSIPSRWNRPRLLSSSPSWKISQPPLPVSKSISLRSSIGSEKNRAFVVCSSASSEGELPIEKRYPAFPAVCDIFKILETLPHRYPFLYVDRVIEYTPGVSIVAIKNVTINDNFFPGHLPERPLMPGVLIIEAMAQVAGILLTQPGEGAKGTVFPFAALDKVRFRKPVMAGDTLVMRMTLVKQQKPFSKLEGKAYVNGQLACEGEFLLGTWQLE